MLIQSARNARHDVVGAQAVGVVLHLLLQIALIQPCQARRGHAVALTVQTMATEAGVVRAARSSPHGDELT